MSSLGCFVRVGADLLHMDRMRGPLEPAFLTRTFTRRELDAGSSRDDSASYLAKVFCGKEAVFKCLGLPADKLRSWTEIEIVDGQDGKPVVSLHGEPAALAETLGYGPVDLSLSYDTDYALAVAAVLGGVTP
jgi:holo-[acyl-carrier protein] synthase